MKSLNDIFSNVDQAFNTAKRGNLEEVLNKTKNYAEQAGKKSAEGIEISKKRIELLDTKSKLNKAYEAFGELQYGICMGEKVSEEIIQTKLQEIQLLKSRTELLEGEINQLVNDFKENLPKRERKAKAEDVEVTVEEEE